jgi:hypothetical protein
MIVDQNSCTQSSTQSVFFFRIFVLPLESNKPGISTANICIEYTA